LSFEQGAWRAAPSVYDGTSIHLALARLDPVDAKHRHEDLIGVANRRIQSRPGKKSV
jgi:hypothetical protein